MRHTMCVKKFLGKTLMVGCLITMSTTAWADCRDLPNHAALTAALQTNVGAIAGGPDNGGLNNHMWATLIDADGVVCAVTKSGINLVDQWGLSRVISAQKANTARGLSREVGSGGAEIALSTANLWAAVQPGGSLFGLQHSNPVDTDVVYRGNSKKNGTRQDPMVRRKIGGVNVFGGGLALYNLAGKMIGGLGTSGDTSCADHNVAWRVRVALGLNNVPAGVGLNGADGINYDLDPVTRKSAGGFGHPECGGGEKAVAIAIGSGG